jgi:hypothetical protein
MQNAGAVAVMVYDHTQEGFVFMKNDGSFPQPDIPAVFITLSEGNYLVALLAKVQPPTPLSPLTVSFPADSGCAWAGKSRLCDGGR